MFASTGVTRGVQHIHTGASTAASTGLLLSVTFSLPLCDGTCTANTSLWGVLKRPLKRTKGKIWDIWGVFNSIPRYSPHTSPPHCTELFNTETPLPSLLWTPWELCALLSLSLSEALPEVYYLSCCLSFAWQLYSQVHGPGQCLYRWGLMSFKLLTRLLQLPDHGPTLYI